MNKMIDKLEKMFKDNIKFTKPITIILIFLTFDLVFKALLYGPEMSTKIRLGDFFIFSGNVLNKSSSVFNLFGFAPGVWFHILLSLIITIGLVTLIIKLDDKWSTLLFSIAIAGVLGNSIDRIFYGGVRDHLNVPWLNNGFFNLADVYVAVCAPLGGLIVLIKNFKNE